MIRFTRTKNRPRYTRFVGLSLAAVLVLGTGRPATAVADAPVTFTETQLASALFGAAARIKASGVEHDKQVILSAELLDWRVNNPGADEAAIDAHLTATRNPVNDRLTPVDAKRSQAEVVGRMLQIVYDVQGTVITGTHMTALLGAATARDLAHLVLSREQRLTGSQQALDIATAYSGAQDKLWTAVHERAATDPAFANVWRQRLGAATAAQPFSLDPTAPSAVLRNLPVLRDLINIDALVAQGNAGRTAFLAEVQRQFTVLQNKVTETTGQLTQSLWTANASAGLPGTSVTPPSQEQISRIQREEEASRKVAGQLKGGVDALIRAAGYVDPKLAKHLTEYALTAFTIANNVMDLVTAVAMIGTSIAVGATFGYVGMAVGAVVGLIEVFAGVLGSASSPDPGALQGILQAINRGFSQLQDSIRSVYDTMTNRFNRLDQRLDAMFQTMREGFNTVIGLIHDVNANLAVVHQQLLSLQATALSFGQAELNAISDGQKNEFHFTATNFVDYGFYNNNRTMSEDQYIAAVSRFLSTANDVARNNAFAYSNYNEPNPRIPLGVLGPAGSIDWLANWANRHYGMNLPVSGGGLMVPNADFWAEAARAYTLTALQNPQYAAREGAAQARATELINNGELIRTAAMRFSAPVAPKPGETQWTATNKLFSGLLNENKTLTQRFADTLPNPKTFHSVINPAHPWDLWAGPNQAFDASGLPGTPASVGICGSGAVPSTPPSYLNPAGLPSEAMLGLYVDPEHWRYNACVGHAHFENPTISVSERVVQHCHPVEGCDEVTYYDSNQFIALRVNFYETVDNTEVGRMVNRVTKTVKSFHVCRWTNRDAPNPNPPSFCQQPPGGSPNTWVGPDVLWNGQPTGPMTKVDANVPYNKSRESVRKLWSEKVASYYNLVADKLDTDPWPEATALGTNLLLLRSYTALGFPRAKDTDDQLHALLYGTHALGGNLSTVYRQAAAEMNERSPLMRWTEPFRFQPELLTDQPNDQYGNPPCVVHWLSTDVATACLLGVSQQRRDRLADRFEQHFHQIYDGTAVEGLPLIDEVLRNLALTKRYVVARFPTSAAAEAAVGPVGPARAEPMEAVAAPAFSAEAPKPAAPPAPAAKPMGFGFIMPGASIPVGRRIEFFRDGFSSGWSSLVMAYDNSGNLVIRDPWGKYLWAADTGGNPDAWAVFQSDGNFVVYDAQNRPLWASDTMGSGFRLDFQHDGNLVIYDAHNRPQWATGTDWKAARG